MKSEDILNAMNLLDPDIIAEAKSGRRKSRRPYRRLATLAAAALVTGVLALSALAATSSSDWFLRFFSERAKQELSSGQIAMIRDSIVDFGQSQTRNGYTITLDSAFTDGRQTFFRFLLTVPEGTRLDADWYGDANDCAIVSREGEDFVESVGLVMGGMGWRHEAVEEKSNQLILIYEIEVFHAGAQRDLSGTVWTFQIDGLACGYRDDEVGLRQETMTEGIWTFDVRFPENCQRQLELVREPMEIYAAQGVGGFIFSQEDLERVMEADSKVLLTSFTLRALTAELSFRPFHKEQINAHFGELYAVLKNGDRVALISNGFAPNYGNYLFSAPIVLDEVDYILFPDGTRLQAN